MALFKTIEQVRAIIPLLSSSEFSLIKPFIEQAERDFIVPLISQTEYDSLTAWYVTEASSTPKERLRDSVQKALALYAVYLWVPSGQLQIGDSGIRIATTDNLKTAFQWQIKAFEANTLRQAGSASEALLVMMEANKGDYAGWTASDSYVRFKDCFINNVRDFSNIYAALGGSYMSFMKIRPQMKQVEEFTIQAELSPAFYAELKAQQLANSLSTKNKLLIPMIQKAVAHLTMARAYTQLVVMVTENGVLNFNSTAASDTITQKEPAKDYMLTKLELQAQNDGDAYIKILKDFLKTNIADYPTYEASTAYDSETTDTAFKNDSSQKGYAAMI